MKRDEPEHLDLLAAEYVLGTLRGAARRSFERRRARDPFVDRRVAAWEDRFALLSLRLRPVAPSAAVWPAIERRTAGAARGAWRALAAAVAVVAVLGFGWIAWQELRPPQATAVLASEEGATLWRLELAGKAAYIDVSTVGTIDVPDARARELWALPEGASPVSLGLMPERGSVRLALDDRQRAALAATVNLAVSDEPEGGSPTGAPTGAVLYLAPLTRT
jgi:anti-sigma-K factor RskA